MFFLVLRVVFKWFFGGVDGSFGWREGWNLARHARKRIDAHGGGGKEEKTNLTACMSMAAARASPASGAGGVSLVLAFLAPGGGLLMGRPSSAASRAASRRWSAR